MQSKKSFSLERARPVFGFALMLIFGAGFLILTLISSAQEAPPPIAVNRAYYNMNGAQANLPKSTVRGRIVYEDNEKPVRRMPFSISFISASPSSETVGNTAMVTNSNSAYYGSSASGVTDANGEFELRNIVAGRYRLRVEAPNVLNDYYPNDNYANSSDNANVAPAAPPAEEFFAPIGGAANVYLRLKRGGIIGGRIRYADGDPAVNVAVMIIPKIKYSASANAAANAAAMTGSMSNMGGSLGGYYGGTSATTDDRGVYRVVGLQPGEYVVRVTERTSHAEDSTSDGYTSYVASFLNWFYPNANEITKAASMRLELGQELTDIDFTLSDRPLYKTVGKVVARGSSQPVQNARIVVRQKSELSTGEVDYTAAQTREVVADERGAFVFKDLPAGKYTASVQSPFDSSEYNDAGEAISSNVPKVSFVPGEKDFEITNQDVTDLTIELQPGAILAGTITTDNNRALTDSLSIYVYDEDKKAQLSDYFSNYDEEGKAQKRSRVEFEILNVPAGKYGVGVSATSYSEAQDEVSETMYLKSVRRAGAPVTLPLQLKEGEVIRDLQVILGTDAGKVRGTVRDKNRAPAANKSMFAITTDQSKWDNYDYYKYTGTNEKGEFEFSGAPGEYAIIFYGDGDFAQLQKQNREAVFAWLRERSSAAPRVTIRPNATETINLTAP